MLDEQQGYYGASPTNVEQDFWLEQGRRILSSYITAIQAAARGLIIALGLLEAAYLAILAFSHCTPKSMPFIQKSLFMTPLLFWLAALYYCLRILMFEHYDINLRSPSDIRTKSQYILEDKHDGLQWAYWLLLTGVLDAALLLIFRMRP
ncbi:MAG: hypothetical protein ACYST6_15350 [Planctomycetota bacterium]|jgi:hypothetical protein